MKTCAICALVSGDEQPTCPACGEASWLVAEASASVVEDLPAEPSESGEAPQADPSEAALAEEKPARSRKTRG